MLQLFFRIRLISMISGLIDGLFSTAFKRVSSICLMLTSLNAFAFFAVNGNSSRILNRGNKTNGQ